MEETDYIKEWVIGVYGSIQGDPGDWFVGLLLVGMLLSLWKRRYRSAVGFVVLICGVVVVRIVISILYGGADFSR